MLFRSLDLDWAAYNLLSRQARKEYKTAEARAWKKYKTATDPARAEARARAEYQQAIARGFWQAVEKEGK